MHKPIARVTSICIALILALAACGSDNDDASTDADAETSADKAGESSDTATAEPDPAADDEEDARRSEGADDDSQDGSEAGNATTSTAAAGANTSAAQTDADDSGVGAFFAFAFGQAGVEITPEIISCVTDRGIDPALGLAATEQQVAEATLAAFACAPEQAGAIVAADTTPPAGTDAQDVECVAVETFRQIGAIPVDEALLALESDVMPDDLRELIVPAAGSACELSDELVEAILDS